MKTNILPVGMTVWMSVLTATVALRASAEQMSTAAKSEKSYTGMVISIDPQEHELRVKKWMFLNKKFNLGDGCAYTFANKSTGAIGDLRPGQEVRVTYQDAHGVLVADRVAQQPMRYEGSVKAIDPMQHTLLLHVHGVNKTLQIANGCKFVLHNDKLGGLSDIQAGDYVTVTYEDPNETPTAQQIAQTSETFTGSLTAIDLEGRTVKAKELFETKKFNVGDDCAIVIDGKPDGKLSDLKPNEKLVLSYDEINGVNVVNRIAPSEASPKDVVVSEPSGDD